MDAPANFVERLGDEIADAAREMTPREEAIPLLAQIVYDQAHKDTSVTVTVHGVDWDTYTAVDAPEQFARGEYGGVTAWKVAKLVDDWPGLEVTYFPAARVVES